MIIALFGPPGAGKDTVGKILVEQYAYRRVAFADKVRELTLRLHGDTKINTEYKEWHQLKWLVDTLGWDHCKRNFEQVRRLLERVGDGCREVLGNDLWLNQVALDLMSGHNIVVTDMRKHNEMRVLAFYDARFWHITRNGCVKRPFDEWQESWATATIENNGTVEELAAKVRGLMNGLTDPPANPSQR